MLAIQFYDVVVAVHVMAIVLAFGVTFAYPIMGPFMGKNAPQTLPAFHRMQERVGKLLIGPFSALAFVTGIYLAADADLFDRVWVQVPLVILIALMGMGGAYFAPTASKLADMAEQQPGSPEYMAKIAQSAKVGIFNHVLILVAIFFMVAKPGGY